MSLFILLNPKVFTNYAKGGASTFRPNIPRITMADIKRANPRNSKPPWRK